MDTKRVKRDSANVSQSYIIYVLENVVSLDYLTMKSSFETLFNLFGRYTTYVERTFLIHS